jgi:iron complex outermembrane receptor protein
VTFGSATGSGESGSDLLAVIEEGETIEAASRHPQSLADAPAYVTVVTKHEIEEFGYETIGEAIASAAGFYTVDDLNYTRLGIRGFAPFGDYGSHVLVMIDGHPMIEPVFASSFFERNQPIDIRCVQRIEIVRGPGSALYGTNAVLSVVNIITTKATESGRVAAAVSGRSNEGGEANVSLGMVGRQGFQARLSGTVTLNEGFDYYFKEFDDPATNSGMARDLDAERTWGMHAQLKRYGWSLSGLVSSRLKHIPTASWDAPFNDDRLRTTDLLGFIDSRYDTPLGSATHLSARLTYDWYSYKGVWPSVGDDAIYVTEDPHTSKVLGGEIEVASEALDRNYVVAGFSLKRVLSATLRAYVTEPEYEKSVDIEKTETLISAFAQDEIAIYGHAVKAILGA